MPSLQPPLCFYNFGAPTEIIFAAFPLIVFLMFRGMKYIRREIMFSLSRMGIFTLTRE